LYGSSVAGDKVKTSDYNVLVVTDRLDAEVLTSLTALCSTWGRGGNPAPMLFEKETLLRSADVFPVEFSDIIQTHKIIYGQNPFEGMKIEPADLRLQLEHELKSKLIILRGRFLGTKGAAKEVEALMVSSVSSFLSLFKAILRLYGENPPAKKMEALPLLAKHIKIDIEIFAIVWDLKEGKKCEDLTSVQLFSRYLTAVQNVTNEVDLWLQKTEN
jgi:predicted nucleotidyltransferase